MFGEGGRKEKEENKDRKKKRQKISEGRGDDEGQERSKGE